ncbi:hypothetical protein EVAR_2974_1 [Eumeta japonica]|uniref:Uncharacterized protein n=1 Tax=Eumeta variegata TaxID=151549 RepID=A0A4C1SU32_EUMVA|nr:hypothetical protein EVAR_2974_1 [Eumeta japonica]
MYRLIRFMKPSVGTKIAEDKTGFIPIRRRKIWNAKDLNNKQGAVGAGRWRTASAGRHRSRAGGRGRASALCGPGASPAYLADVGKKTKAKVEVLFFHWFMVENGILTDLNPFPLHSNMISILRTAKHNYCCKYCNCFNNYVKQSSSSNVVIVLVSAVFSVTELALGQNGVFKVRYFSVCNEKTEERCHSLKWSD